MDVEIKPLTPELAEDFLGFFDHTAFSDHPEWSWCYCMFYHFCSTDLPEWEKLDKPGVRSKAAGRIMDGGMHGYLLYVDGNVAGWCNTGDKAGYRRLVATPSLWQDENDVKVKSIVCFIIAPAFRRQGLASLVLGRVCADAVDEGYSFVEAYPAAEGPDCFGQYHGHLSMYLKHGFSQLREEDGFTIVRKECVL
jgi:hypothetical protein